MKQRHKRAPQGSVLIFGYDLLLLETRSMVLESAGFKVCVTSDVSQAQQALSEPGVGILILCHTLHAEQCHRVLSLAREQQPGPKVLVLAGNDAECPAQEGDVVLQGFATARNLISAVQAAVSGEGDAALK